MPQERSCSIPIRIAKHKKTSPAYHLKSFLWNCWATRKSFLLFICPSSSLPISDCEWVIPIRKTGSTMCTIAHGHLSNSAGETIEMSDIERVGATRQTWLKSKQVGHLGRFLGGHLLCSVTCMFLFAQVPESCCILQGPRRDLVPADNGCVTGPNRQNSYFNKVARDICRNSAISANWFFWLNLSTSINPLKFCSS